MNHGGNNINNKNNIKKKEINRKNNNKINHKNNNENSYSNLIVPCQASPERLRVRIYRGNRSMKLIGRLAKC